MHFTHGLVALEPLAAMQHRYIFSPTRASRMTGLPKGQADRASWDARRLPQIRQEMKMASLTFSNALLPLAGTDKSDLAETTKQGFFSRLMDAMIESRRRSAEREINRLELVYGFKLRGDDALSLKVENADLPFGK
jgi:hypothetical protein